MSTISEEYSRRAVGMRLLKCTFGLALLSSQAPTLHAASTDDHSSQTQQQIRKGESNNIDRVLEEETYMPTEIPTEMPTTQPIDDTQQPSPAPMSIATPNPSPSPVATASMTPAPMVSAGTTSTTDPESPTPKWPFNQQPQPVGTSPYTIQPISVSKPSAQISPGGNVNNYCGTGWSDAYMNCPLACPGGEDAECTSLGEGYKCQVYTGCHEKLGLNSPPTPPAPTPPVPASTNPPTPKPTSQPVEPAEPIAFPACVPEYTSGNDYTFGALVSYPTTDGTVEVYECQGDLCNAGPTHAPGGENGHLTWSFIGTCTPSSTSTDPTTSGGNGIVCPGASIADPNARWWLRNEGGTQECVCGVSYPDRFMTNSELMERFIFMSESACCDRYPIVCGMEVVSTPVPSPSMASSGSTSPAPTMVTPSPDGSSIVPTTLPTYQGSQEDTTWDDDSSASVKGHGFIILSVATVAVALFI